MADDLDAELLALAGDSSDEESPPTKKEKASSPAPSSLSHSPHDSSTMARKGTAKVVKRSRQSRKVDMEDGEL